MVLRPPLAFTEKANTIDDRGYNLFADGGCIGQNPSSYGGTWAWVFVIAGKRVAYDSGTILPGYGGLKKITNNLTELCAALSGLEYVLSEWEGVKGCLWTDSRVTWYRLNEGCFSFKGIPLGLKEKCLKLRRNGMWIPKLLKGHPTWEDLKRGYTKKGWVVSHHNVFCDEACQEESRNFISKLGKRRR